MAPDDPERHLPGVLKALLCCPSCHLAALQASSVVTFLLVSMVISPVNSATHSPTGYSCFLDVDFCLITQTVHRSVNF